VCKSEKRQNRICFQNSKIPGPKPVLDLLNHPLVFISQNHSYSSFLGPSSLSMEDKIIETKKLVKETRDQVSLAFSCLFFVIRLPVFVTMSSTPSKHGASLLVRTNPSDVTFSGLISSLSPVTELIQQQLREKQAKIQSSITSITRNTQTIASCGFSSAVLAFVLPQNFPFHPHRLFHSTCPFQPSLFIHLIHFQ
jgi:hypothetical protein